MPIIHSPFCFFLLAPLVRELNIVVCRREDVQYRTTVMQLGIATFYAEKKAVRRMFTGTLSKQSFRGVQIYVHDAGLAQTLEKDFQFDERYRWSEWPKSSE